ncbi:hypothetical protein MUK42_36954 [Musa troglodytarum]|uniref:Uncharacterized protein n=1 Tax=Musa troglodytarum TaxID=320322 RepID=A0A9E7F776_9LILI|nr:hypothetical protein MUK42_36954 [Musa troglodytarum]
MKPASIRCFSMECRQCFLPTYYHAWFFTCSLFWPMKHGIEKHLRVTDPWHGQQHR